MRPYGRNQQRAVTRVEVCPVHVVHGGPGVGRALRADGPAEGVGVVVVVVVCGVPGLRRGLVEVAVQGSRGVRVCREGKLGVGRAQSAAQRRCDRRLIRAVPERGREAALTHRE